MRRSIFGYPARKLEAVFSTCQETGLRSFTAFLNDGMEILIFQADFFFGSLHVDRFILSRYQAVEESKTAKELGGPFDQGGLVRGGICPRMRSR